MQVMFAITLVQGRLRPSKQLSSAQSVCNSAQGHLMQLARWPGG